jgi:opacity protein-like surface antigen
MKKLTLSLAAIFAMGTFAVAGGDIAPVEPVVEEPVIESTGQFYLGIGYGYFDQTMDNIANTALDIEAETDNVMLQAGYQFNEYIAVEARWWIGVGDATWTASNNYRGFTGDQSGDYSSWGIYVKPMYPVTDSFNVYALLGYASTSLESDSNDDFYWDTDEFSWGLGAEFGVTDNVFIFADYVNLGYPGSFDWTTNGSTVPDVDVDGDLYTFNIGVTYKF